MPAFQLDSRLDADTWPILELSLCSLRLLNDSRWPWLVLVPRVAEACELHDLSAADVATLSQEAVLAGRLLKALTGAEKINTAAIGNIVRQLHVHVIARQEGDANWPGPVWGYGTKTPYAPQVGHALIEQVRNTFKGISA